MMWGVGTLTVRPKFWIPTRTETDYCRGRRLLAQGCYARAQSALGRSRAGSDPAPARKRRQEREHPRGSLFALPVQLSSCRLVRRRLGGPPWNNAKFCASTDDQLTARGSAALSPSRRESSSFLGSHLVLRDLRCPAVPDARRRGNRVYVESKLAPDSESDREFDPLSRVVGPNRTGDEWVPLQAIPTDGTRKGSTCQTSECLAIVARDIDIEQGGQRREWPVREPSTRELVARLHDKATGPKGTEVASTTSPISSLTNGHDCISKDCSGDDGTQTNSTAFTWCSAYVSDTGRRNLRFRPLVSTCQCDRRESELYSLPRTAREVLPELWRWWV